jgi:FixJ family two-component response regulator
VAESSIVCIVDDNAWSRRGLADLVLSLGYPARVFESAEQFVESDSIGETACLITDLHMPGASGLELQSHLRREGHRIPVILVTARPNDDDRALAFASGAVCVLPKPLDERLLIACLTLTMAR